MLTQETLTVLEIAAAVNLIVIAALIATPRVRRWWYRRALNRWATADTSSDARASSPALDAGQPWFAAPVANGSAEAAAARDEAPLNGAAESLPPLASPSRWATWLDEEAARRARYDRPATIVLVELAGLERLADRVGQAAAEQLIPPVAATIRRHARASDRLAHLDATRFGVLLIETDEVSAINYVERIRSYCDVWLAAGGVSLRLSVGWAEIRPDRTVDAAVREAEQRMFADRRRTEPAGPATATEGRDGPRAVRRPSGPDPIRPARRAAAQTQPAGQSHQAV
jgi:diguanylate cyclase (GGDEF)-like protein